MFDTAILQLKCMFLYQIAKTYLNCKKKKKKKENMKEQIHVFAQEVNGCIFKG
jgi:hypothetical protein